MENLLLPFTIADVYNLRHAQALNDEVLERINIGRRFKNDTEWLEKLFALYAKMTTTAKAKSPSPQPSPQRGEGARIKKVSQA